MGDQGVEIAADLQRTIEERPLSRQPAGMDRVRRFERTGQRDGSIVCGAGGDADGTVGKRDVPRDRRVPDDALFDGEPQSGVGRGFARRVCEVLDPFGRCECCHVGRLGPALLTS